MAALAILAVACSSGANRVAATKTSPATTAAVSRQSTLIEAQSDLPVGTSRFVFGIADPDNNVITTGQPQVFVARDERSAPFGPFPATWQTWSPSAGDAFGKPPIPGFFVAQVDIPTPGTWLIVVRDAQSGQTIEAAATIPVVSHQVAGVGSPAISEPTPVATTDADAAKIDTRQPPTPMHYISLDAALHNGKPTVLVFATPQLCQTRLCGPVVDEVLAIYNRVGPARANFVDVEIYPSRDPDKPAPEFLRWGFQSEPWVLVINMAGAIAARFEGPSVAAEILGALNPLLAPG